MLANFSIALSIACVGTFAVVSPSVGRPLDNDNLPEQREIHNTFSGNEKNGSILDATNPMELINRLRQATAMDNATSPSDAIDDALKAFDEEQLENAPLEVIKTSEN